MRIGVLIRSGVAVIFGAFCSIAALAADIVLAQSAALSGPAQALGREMQAGAMLYFDSVNAAGGVRGKRIVLKTLDDGYEPKRARAKYRKVR